MADDEDESEENVFRGLSELPVSPGEKRSCCERCKRPNSVCLCASLPPTPLQVSTTVHILQHPREEYRLLATVPLLAACLPPEKCQIHKGRRFSKNEFSNLHELVLQPNTFILYPGPSAVDIKAVVEFSGPYNLIVPDGTWRQARDIFKNNPFLHNSAKQVMVDNENISEYVIRTQPNNKCLSTLEAIALALSALEKNDQLYKILVSPLKALCQIQLDHGAVPHISKEEQLKRLEESQSQGPPSDEQQKKQNEEPADEGDSS